MPPTSFRDDVAVFAAAVRSHLADLPADEVEDLTDGLEADLLDQAEDQNRWPVAKDAARYADELRTAAGLPSKPLPVTSPTLRERLIEFDLNARAKVTQFVRSSRFGAWLIDLLVAMRPAWWLFRGWAVYVTIWMLAARQSRLLPTELLGWAMLFAVVLVSVQWGRGRWLPQRWLKAVRVLMSAAAIAAAPILALGVLDTVNNAVEASQVYSNPSPVGLNLDGRPVTNIFGYDADGHPIAQIQLFDQNGDPLVTVGQNGTGQDADYNGGPGSVPIPYAKVGDNRIWNVFPLREAPLSSDGSVDTSRAQDAALPMRSTTPLSAYSDARSTPAPTTSTAPTPATTATR